MSASVLDPLSIAQQLHGIKGPAWKTFSKLRRTSPPPLSLERLTTNFQLWSGERIEFIVDFSGEDRYLANHQ